MPERVPLLVVGAGPAGLCAAAAALGAGVETVLLDDQPGPGGQIYRAVAHSSDARRAVLGADYEHGEDLLDALPGRGFDYRPGATVWQVTPGRMVLYSVADKAAAIQADHIVFATGAMERPMPFPGWTLPGVMSAGAAQILLKSSGLVADGAVVLAGSGPFLFLLAGQLVKAGARLSAIVETTPRDNYLAALRYLGGALGVPSYLRRGVALLATLRRAGVPRHTGARDLVAYGDGRVEGLRFRVNRADREIACDLLLIHQGVVPNVQVGRSLGLAHRWDALQRCWRPHLDIWGQSQVEGISIAGDGGGIIGAEAAEHHGRLAGLQAAHRLGKLGEAERDRLAAPHRRALERHRAARTFLDRLYLPAPEFLDPPDETVVCRCEEVTAGQIRDFVRLGCLGPNQTKAFGRPGMGPCQGRLCGLSVAEIIAEARGVPVAEVGYYRIRPPIKPVTLAELATLDETVSP